MDLLALSRVTLEAPVIDPGSFAQAVRAAAGVAYEPVEDTELHLTILHVGKPADIFAVVQAARATSSSRALDPERFVHDLAVLLHQLVLTSRHDAPARTGEVLTLGVEPPLALVVRLELSAALADLHELMLKQFSVFLETQGAADGDALLRHSPAFGFTGKSWLPHVTVGKSMHKVSGLMPAQDVQLGALRIRNGSGLGVF